MRLISPPLIFSIVFSLFSVDLWAADSAKYTSEQLLYRELHESDICPKALRKKPQDVSQQDRYDVKAALSCYKIVEDDETDTGKALSVKLNKRFVQQSEFWVLKTPAMGPLPVGTYRATVRMKMQGMPNSLGSAITIKAGDQVRDVWMNEFLEENAYQEFTLDFESREADIVTRMDGDQYFWRDLGDTYTIGARFKSELPAIDEQLQRNELPWQDRISYKLASYYLYSVMDLPPEKALNRELTVKAGIQKYAALIKPEIQKYDGRCLEFKKDAKDNPLPEKIVNLINRHGILQPDGVVRLSFPENRTGQGNQSYYSSRGPTTPQPTLRQVVIDWIKVEKLPEADAIVIREVTCRRRWCRPGETQPIGIWLHNRSGKDQTGKLRLLVRNGVDHEAVLMEKDVAMKSGTYERADWVWAIPTNQHVWGQAIVAQLIKNDQPVSEERAWFSLHPYMMAMYMHKGDDYRFHYRFHHPYAQTVPNLGNYVETIGSRCESLAITPEPDVLWEPYSSLFGRNLASMAGMYAVTKGLRQEGIGPMLYLSASTGAGQMALEVYWDHPDWVPDLPANSDDFLIERRRTENLALKFYHGQYMSTNGAPPEISRSGGAYAGELVWINSLVEEMVKPMFEGTPRLMENTGYIGIRFDGLPFLGFNTKSLGGTYGKTPQELKLYGAELVKKYKQEMRAKFPGFDCYANAGVKSLQMKQEDPYDFDKPYKVLMETDPLQAEFIKDHGAIMEEMWMSYAHLGEYKNNCLNFLRAAHYEDAAYKMAGGHHGQMLWYYDEVSQYTPDEIYQQLFCYLAGCHMSAVFGPIVESEHDFSLYASCFSEFFWDPELRPIYHMADKVSTDAEADLWVTETGFQKLNEKGNMLYVIPVINPPVTEIWSQNKFGLLPEPIREPFGMTVKIPEGYAKAVEVYDLANSPYPHVKKLEFQNTPGEVVFKLPGLVMFKVAVVEFSK